MLKSDKQGFLVGELVKGQRDMLDFQQASMPVWRDIRTNVRAIARALGVSGRAATPAGRKAGPVAAATPSASRSRMASSQPRDAAGRFVAAVRAATPTRASREERQAGKARAQVVATATAAAAKAAASQRDGRGRFSKGGGRGAGGGDGGGDDAGPGLGSNIAERLGGLKTAIEGLANGTEQVDPAVAAVHEVKDVVAPLGRGMFALLGRSAEKKKERWYRRFLAALTRRKPEEGRTDPITPGEGAGIGAVAGAAARFLPMILTGLGALLGGGLALFLGTKLGTAIYKWLDDSGIATKIFDAFDALRDWIQSKIEGAKQVAKDFNSARELARAGIGGSSPVISAASGRDLNDPRRLDVPQGVAAGAGRILGNIQRGIDYASGESARTAAENRALIVGRQYRAGNIAGLSDAQTRALVASTVATESSGGNLGVVNKMGYMGRYQAGAGWLADAGLIAGGPDAVRAAMKADGFARESDWAKAGGMSRFLKNDANWAGGMSYGSYLRSADTQDAAFKTNSDRAYAEMVRRGIIGPDTPESTVAGLLKARHLAGVGGAASVAAGGTGPADANGTSARKYFEDIARDRGGFLSSYSGSAAAVGAQRVPQVAMPSGAPDRIPDAPAVMAPSGGSADKDKPVRAVLREPVGQDVGDRKIAHIVSGGIGG